MTAVSDIGQYSDEYKTLDKRLAELGEGDPAQLLIAFPIMFLRDKSLGTVVCEYDEVTALCPWTDQPDQGRLVLMYKPAESLLELKSFKYYLQAFRNRHIAQEHLAEKILDDLKEKLGCYEVEVTLDYKPRGGIHTVYTLAR